MSGSPGPPTRPAPYDAGPVGVPWGPPPDHPQAATVLVLGILGVATLPVLAPVAWYVGNQVRREIELSGGRWGGLQQVSIGRVLGVVGTCLLAAVLGLVLLYVAGVALVVGGALAAG